MSGYFLTYHVAKMFLDTRTHKHMIKNIEKVWRALNYRYMFTTLKLIISGKWFGNMRTNERTLKIGRRIKSQSFESVVDYSSCVSKTIYGVFNIKLWLSREKDKNEKKKTQKKIKPIRLKP